MKRTILLVVLAVLALGLVPMLAQANHCPGTSPPSTHDERATNPVTGGHIYTIGSPPTTVGTHGNTGWVQVGAGGVQGSSSGGEVAGHVGADGVGIQVLGNCVV